MQRSLILPIASRYLLPLLLIFSFFLLIRGHNEIGGGFVGGLVASAALMLYAIAVSPKELGEKLPVRPVFIAALGLLLAAISTIIPLFFGKPFLTGIWLKEPVAVLGKIGTPLLFDTGVYLVVVGVVLWIMLTLAED